MKFRLAFAGLAVGVVTGSFMVRPLKVLAQEVASDTTKRTVRTKVEPMYPQVARQMNLAGRVKIEATISADGHVVNTRVVGGSPILVSAALDALKRWRFEPAARESTETFEFAFSR